MTAPSDVARQADRISEVRRFVRDRRAADHPFRTDGSALLVIDMQRYFIDPRSHAYFPQVEAIVGNVQKVIEQFRAKGLPIFFTAHALEKGENPGGMGRWWGDVLTVDDPLAAIDERLRPLTTETVIRKTHYSAFVGTNLDGLLKRSNITRLVIVGIMTHLCCESTARDAFMRDYEVFFVVDATATKHEELHVGSLRALADGFSILATTEEVCRWIGSGQ